MKFSAPGSHFGICPSSSKEVDLLHCQECWGGWGEEEGQARCEAISRQPGERAHSMPRGTTTKGTGLPLLKSKDNWRLWLSVHLVDT